MFAKISKKVVAVALVATMAVTTAAVTAKIGRASCRERV